MRDLLLWVPDWLAHGLMHAAALVSRRVWATQKTQHLYIVVPGDIYHAGPIVAVVHGRCEWVDTGIWDGWVPGRYV